MNTSCSRYNDRYQLSAVRSLFLVLALLSPALVASGPAQAQSQREIDRRIQIVVKSITIIDDHDDDLDLDGGELTFRVSLRETRPGCPQIVNVGPCAVPTLVEHTIALSGSDSEVVSVSETIPNFNSTWDPTDRRVSSQLGVPLFADESYALRVSGQERDLFRTDQLGTATLHLTLANAWQRGETSVRASKDGGETPNGDFIVHLEIHDVPLPDLRPVNLRVVDVPGSGEKNLCVAILNSGLKEAPQVYVGFNSEDEGIGSGVTPTDALPAGEQAELCIPLEPPASGPHVLSVTVDGQLTVEEVSDTNNVMEVPYTAPAPSGSGADPSPTPSPAPSPMAMPSPKPGMALPDLTITAIKINGRVPDGKDDCKDGKNTVTVRIKNAGMADAGSFAVSLSEDLADVALGEQTVDGLKMGQEREVRFDGVRLKKGTQKIEAYADLREKVSESSEANNKLMVTASCKDDD